MLTERSDDDTNTCTGGPARSLYADFGTLRTNARLDADPARRVGSALGSIFEANDNVSRCFLRALAFRYRLVRPSLFQAIPLIPQAASAVEVLTSF